MIWPGPIAGEVAHGGGATPTLVITSGANDDAGGASDITSTGVDTTGASLLVLCISSWTNGANPTVSDSYGNTWTILGPVSGFSGNVIIAYAWNPTVGTGHTFTVENVGSNGVGFTMQAWAGIKVSADPLVAHAGQNTNPGPTNQPGSITAPANDLLIAMVGAYQGFSTPGIFTFDSGFTIPENGGLGSGSASVSTTAAYLISTGSAVNPTSTSVGADTTSAQCGHIAAFAHA